jgi:pyruvate formate lyase activating enzyme
MLSGLVTNIQRYSTQDGPGIRTTVFFKGCPLDCWWCHNPEGRFGSPEVIVQETRCIRCGECVKVCPTGSPAQGGGPREPSRECTRCGACVDACPTGARQMAGERRSADDVLAEVLRDRLFFDESKGGVTFSGGEPLMQPQFLEGLLDACRARGIHTAVDTCGYAPVERFMSIARTVDLFLYDLKAVDDAKHVEYTGVSNSVILGNLRQLGAVHRNIWLRGPIIPTLNDSDDQLDALARFAAAIPGVTQVNLLPYHRTGVQKFKRLGLAYRLEHLRPPSPERMESALSRFRAFGLNAKSGG